MSISSCLNVKFISYYIAEPNMSQQGTSWIFISFNFIFCCSILHAPDKLSMKIYSDDNTTENVEIIYWFVHYLISDLVNFDLFEGRSG